MSVIHHFVEIFIITNGFKMKSIIIYDNNNVTRLCTHKMKLILCRTDCHCTHYSHNLLTAYA